MGDQHIFGMVDPVTGQNCYGTVMGHLGSYFAFALYRGKAGYKSMLSLLSEEETTDPEEALYEQDCIIVSFELESDADGEDVALMESVAKDAVDIDRIPGFRSYRQGLMPWSIDEEEGRLIEGGMRLCIQVVCSLQEDPAYLTPCKEDKGKLRFFRKNGSNWISQWEAPDNILDFSPSQLQVNAGKIDELKQLPNTEGMWLFERFLFRQPSMDESSERPYFPVTFLFMDLETQVICGMDLVRPARLEEDGGEVLLQLIQDAGKLPSALVVSKKENYILIHPISRALGLEVHLEESLNVLPDIKAALYRQLDYEG